MLKVNIYRRTHVNDVKRERAHEREVNRKMIILLNILGSNPLMTKFCPSPQYLTKAAQTLCAPLISSQRKNVCPIEIFSELDSSVH